MKIKSKTNNFKLAPWQMSSKLLETFTLVTDINKKEVLVLGRILYSISILAKFRTYRGFFEIDPGMSKGRMTIKNHMYFDSYSTYRTETESIEDYQKRFKPISILIEQKKLYYRTTDKIVKYVRQ